MLLDGSDISTIWIRALTKKELRIALIACSMALKIEPKKSPITLRRPEIKDPVRALYRRAGCSARRSGVPRLLVREGANGFLALKRMRFCEGGRTWREEMQIGLSHSTCATERALQASGVAARPFKYDEGSPKKRMRIRGLVVSTGRLRN